MTWDSGAVVCAWNLKDKHQYAGGGIAPLF